MPRFFIREIDSTGKITIDFTSQMVIPENLTDFEETAFLIQMIPANAEHKEQLNFTWTLVQFKPFGC